MLEKGPNNIEVCNSCGQPLSNHAEDCPFNATLNEVGREVERAIRQTAEGMDKDISSLRKEVKNSLEDIRKDLDGFSRLIHSKGMITSKERDELKDKHYIFTVKRNGINNKYYEQVLDKTQEDINEEVCKYEVLLKELGDLSKEVKEAYNSLSQ